VQTFPQTLISSLMFIPLSSAVAIAMQQPADNTPTTALKATSRLVQVDVVADDGHNHAVTDLQPEDFTLLEDGKVQKLTSVTLQRPEKALAADPRVLPPNTFTNRPYFSQRSTLNIVLLDSLNTNVADQINARKQMIKFIQKMPAGEPTAVYVLGNKLKLIQDFTADPQILQRAIESLNANPTALNKGVSDDQLPAGYLDQWSGKMNVGASPALGQSADMGGGPGSNTQVQVDLMMFEQEMINLQDDMRAQYTMDSFKALARRLSGFLGRKNLIWLSAGFPIAVNPDIALGANAFSVTRNRGEEIAKAANALIDADIAIYPVDIRGLVGSSNAAANGFDSLGRRGASGPAIVDNLRNSENGIILSQDSSRDLADRTGGKAYYNRNDFDTAIASSVIDGSTYYLLTYSPDNKNWNGKFRKISVKVDRPGVKLRNRMGYYATDATIYQKTDAKAKEADFRHALDANVPLSTALTFLVNVAPQKNQVVIRYNVDAHNIAFDLQPDGLSHAEIECAAWIYTAKGKPVTFQTDFMRAGVKQEAISGIVQQGFPCDQSLNLAKGEYLMRLGVRDTNTGLFGTSNASVIVP
jgi:VWFA-related protein